MKTLHRNKRKLYLCELYEENGLKKYKEPVELRENWQVTSSDVEFKNLGLDSYDYVRIKTSVSHSSYYHLGDRLYISVTPPEKHDVMCKTADYEVYKDPVVTLNECEVLLKRLSGKNAKSIF